ncbi:MAG TPA: M14 family metallopeptidase [Blastocatellia bacterium]|nr:M14 family metallopeptidase [Blastocatellia bacterium]
MKPKLITRLSAISAVTVLFVCLLIAPSVSTGHTGQNDLKLKARLSSTRFSEFDSALRELEARDDSKLEELWSAALNNPNATLSHKAWQRYSQIQASLVRKSGVPQVARILAPAADITRNAEASRLGVTIWSSSQSETVAAVPPYVLDHLRESGITCNVLYDSIAAWQDAAKHGDTSAIAITPPYLSQQIDLATQIRIAVIDLADRTTPEPGHSDWLGDREDILIRDGSRIAYLDRFQSDGSDASIAEHIRHQYTSKGYRLQGLFTPEQFERVSSTFFPGKTFSAGTRTSAQSGAIHPELADGKFHNYDETLAEFKSLADGHPDLAQFVKIGTSYEGRDIFALKISRNASGDDPTKPEVLITGCHHAREWISVEPPVYFANQLLNNYSTDDSIRFLVDSLQIWIVPIVNPDGLTYSQQSPNDRMDAVRTWRKNRRPISLNGCVSSVGVDLNRNYSYKWRLAEDSPCTNYCSASKSCTDDDVGASDDPFNDTYRGPSPESEPEILAIKSLVDDPNRRFRAELDYHNYGQLILYPWGFENQASNDADTLSAIAADISSKLNAVNGKLYHPEQAIDLYPTTGSSIDYTYAVRRVAAPFVVEMRPDCCEFDVPESDILAVNRENYAGAQPLLNWAAGPPILQSVRAFSRGPDGAFSNLVYSARWSASTGSDPPVRELIVDTRFGGIQPGPLLVSLQFSKPMLASLAPRATLGRDERTDELRLVAVSDREGWQKTVYPNDTWIGETVIAEDENQTSPWRLAAIARDESGMQIDARPQTFASYPSGSGHWLNFEDPNGQGFDGGIDLNHTLAPTLLGSFPGLFIASPSGGERLAAGDVANVVWALPSLPGFFAASQKILLSTDGGSSFEQLEGGISGGIEKKTLLLPQVATTQARMRVEAVDATTGNAIFGDTLANFTIGLNLGADVDVSLISADKLTVSWMDSLFEGSGTVSGPLRLALRLRVTNRGGARIVNPFVRVADLTRSNVVLSRDAGSPLGAGSRQSIDGGPDNALDPGESVELRIVLGLQTKKKFQFSLGVYGVPVGGPARFAPPVTVWSGKPKSQ